MRREVSVLWHVLCTLVLCSKALVRVLDSHTSINFLATLKQTLDLCSNNFLTSKLWEIPNLVSVAHYLIVYSS